MLHYGWLLWYCMGYCCRILHSRGLAKVHRYTHLLCKRKILAAEPSNLQGTYRTNPEGAKVKFLRARRELAHCYSIILLLNKCWEFRTIMPSIGFCHKIERSIIWVVPNHALVVEIHIAETKNTYWGKFAIQLCKKCQIACAAIAVVFAVCLMSPEEKVPLRRFVCSTAYLKLAGFLISTMTCPPPPRGAATPGIYRLFVRSKGRTPFVGTSYENPTWFGYGV